MNSDPGQPKTRRGILLTTDLLFSTKVTGTASALGQELAVAGDVAKAVELCRARPCAYVIIHLGMAEITSPQRRLRAAPDCSRHPRGLYHPALCQAGAALFLLVYFGWAGRKPAEQPAA